MNIYVKFQRPRTISTICRRQPHRGPQRGSQKRTHEFLYICTSIHPSFFLFLHYLCPLIRLGQPRREFWASYRELGRLFIGLERSQRGFESPEGRASCYVSSAVQAAALFSPQRVYGSQTCICGGVQSGREGLSVWGQNLAESSQKEGGGN